MDTMTESTRLDDFIGNQRIVDVLRRAMAQDRMPHAMIFSGPAGVGKCTLAFHLAQLLNCLSPRNRTACGECTSCRKIGATLKSRNLQCLSLQGEGFCGVCSNCKLMMRKHPDVRLIVPEKTTIRIDQVRELIDEAVFQPFEARYRVAILDPADQMTIEAQNSLLKTLEEPSSRTVIILVTTNPYLLLETIRSRSRLLQFAEIPQDAIEQFLVSRLNLTPENAHLAAALSGGSLGTAMDFDTDGYREIREGAFRFIQLLLEGKNFAEASDLAGQAAKDKKLFATWIDAVMALLQDIYYAATAPERIGQIDMRAQLEKLAGITPRTTIVRAIEAVRKLKRELQFNVNRQLALEAMFLSVGSGQ
jgi:DNA polymerase-3 subunit delta'